MASARFATIGWLCVVLPLAAVSAISAGSAVGDGSAPKAAPSAGTSSSASAPAVSDFGRDLAWQIALDGVCFSPGLIDGSPGPKTALATREFQRTRGLPVTGTLDQATADALGIDAGAAKSSYTITAADIDSVAPPPAGWLEKSKQKHLGYESLDWCLAEKFHCTRALLTRLNGKSVAALKAGQTVVVPAVRRRTPPAAERIEINLTQKVIRALDAKGTVVGMFHCSIAADPDKRPAGAAKVVSVTENPVYRFDPAMWPEVKGIDHVLMIPPGPRNPVGLCWIALSLEGYGMHGTPNPELIGKTGSHGCFRLPNWDALTLGKMVREGMEVRFVK